MTASPCHTVSTPSLGEKAEIASAAVIPIKKMASLWNRSGSSPNPAGFKATTDLRQSTRCVSEALAADLSVTRGDMQWEADLVAVHHQLANTPRRDPKDPTHLNEQWQILHKNFHMMLLSACDCQPMVKLASDLSDATELYRAWAAPSVAAGARDVEKEHQDILDAALARNAKQLSKLLREHYEATVKVVLESGLAE